MNLSDLTSLAKPASAPIEVPFSIYVDAKKSNGDPFPAAGGGFRLKLKVRDNATSEEQVFWSTSPFPTAAGAISSAQTIQSIYRQGGMSRVASDMKAGAWEKTRERTTPSLAGVFTRIARPADLGPTEVDGDDGLDPSDQITESDLT